MSAYPRSWLAIYSIDGRLDAVRVVYSDETEMNVGDSSVVLVAAVVLNLDTQWGSLLMDFGNLPESWKHRREIKGRRLLRDLHVDRGPDSASALRTICEIPVARGIPIFCNAIDRAGWESWQADVDHFWPDKPRVRNIQQAAFAGCLRKVESYLETLLRREKAIWIADVSDYQSQAKDSLQDNKDWAMNGPRLGKYADPDIPEHKFLPHVIDTIYFGDSHESLALQLADVCCSVIGAHLLGDPIAEPYYEMIEPQIVGGEPKVEYKRRKRSLPEQPN